MRLEKGYRFPHPAPIFNRLAPFQTCLLGHIFSGGTPGAHFSRGPPLPAMPLPPTQIGANRIH